MRGVGVGGFARTAAGRVCAALPGLRQAEDLAFKSKNTETQLQGNRRLVFENVVVCSQNRILTFSTR